MDKKLENKVKQTLSKLKLSKKEKILVALSGGKDSSTTAYLLHKLGYNIEGLHIDLSMGRYSKRCLDAVKKLCDNLNIKLHVYDIKKEMGSSMCYLRSSVQQKKSLKNCAICGVIKKHILNKQTRKLRAKKIATGHNLDDEVQTFLINVFKASLGLSATSGPITKNIQDKKFIPRVKPLFYILEDDIRKYSKQNKLPVVYDKCPCAINSYRIQVRNFLEKMPAKQKENILNNFEKLSSRLQKTKNTKINYCKICEEPSRKQICKKCDLMN